MNPKYKVTIGIEIHLELKTKTKMFSSTPNTFGKKPNSQVNEIDLGYPGAMPSVNKTGVIFGILLAKALQMKIDSELHFDRKHYYYPDLPKGYQITQNFRPIGTDGFIEIGLKKKKILIERIHLEEDTAKQIHLENETYLDFNRAGVPLIEIVTRPVISTAEDAVLYVKSIHKLARALGISDAKMEESSLRADANISLAPIKSSKLGNKVEIKNINSFVNLKKAIDMEIETQKKVLDKSQTVTMTTKRFDEKTQTNILMRYKEEAIDYKYFKEPNILPIKLTDDFINSIKLPLLPNQKQALYQKIGLNSKMIEQLLNNDELGMFFDSFDYPNKLFLAKIIFSELLPLTNKLKTSIFKLNISKEQFVETIKLLEENKITRQHLKRLIPFLDGKKQLSNLLKEHEIFILSDPSEIKKILFQIVKNNSNLIENKEINNKKTANFILGQMMKITQGNINIKVAQIIIDKYLEQSN